MPGGGIVRQPSDAVPNTAVYAQVDTAGVQLPAELSAFCRRGTTSMRQAAAPPAFTEPVHAVAIPRDEAPVRFIEKIRYGPSCRG